MDILEYILSIFAILGAILFIVAIYLSINNDKDNPLIEEYSCEELRQFAINDEGIPRPCRGWTCYPCDAECVFRSYTIKCIDQQGFP